LYHTYVIDFVLPARGLKPIPAAVIYEISLFSRLIGNVWNFEGLELILARARQLELFELEDLINHRDLGRFEPATRVTTSIGILPCPLGLELVLIRSWDFFLLPRLNFHEVLLLVFGPESPDLGKRPIVCWRKIPLDSPEGLLPLQRH
jgi:hypothetical protein